MLLYIKVLTYATTLFIMKWLTNIRGYYMLIRSTKDTVNDNGVKMIVYGQSGAGKTTLIKTLPDPIIISAESGLSAISDVDIPYITVNSVSDLLAAYKFLKTDKEASKFKTIAIDSISEIAEVCLAQEKKASKDPRKAYGNMSEKMIEFIRLFRDLPKHVYISAKLDKIQDDTGRIFYSPSMPGKQTGAAMPYFFDIVAALRVEKDSDGNIVRFLQCQPDGIYSAKIRTSGNVEILEHEEPDLGALIKKLGGTIKQHEDLEAISKKISECKSLEELDKLCLNYSDHPFKPDVIAYYNAKKDNLKNPPKELDIDDEIPMDNISPQQQTIELQRKK